MKFNWGTGIAIFLVLFLAAAAAFIIFAVNQDVNLVHKDYYEKGVDYSEQMKVESRSEIFRDKVQVSVKTDGMSISIDSLLASTIDSGTVILFRPSDKMLDVTVPLGKNGVTLIPADKVSMGRYIVKVNWFVSGAEYEIKKDINIQ